jgi:hypothetical protein
MWLGLVRINENDEPIKVEREYARERTSESGRPHVDGILCHVRLMGRLCYL